MCTSGRSCGHLGVCFCRPNSGDHFPVVKVSISEKDLVGVMLVSEVLVDVVATDLLLSVVMFVSSKVLETEGLVVVMRLLMCLFSEFDEDGMHQSELVASEVFLNWVVGVVNVVN